MSVPTCGITHDVVIYDGAGNISPLGLIVRPFSYRVGEAPSLVPRMAAGDPKGIDFEDWVSWVQDDWRSGEHQRNAPLPANARYARSQWLLPDREQGYLGVHAFPIMSHIVDFNTMVNTVVTDRNPNALRFVRPQRRWWHIPAVADTSGLVKDGSEAHWITWRGAWRVGAGGTQVNHMCDWGNQGYSAIDACHFSHCAIVAVQRSHTRGTLPDSILVHHNQIWWQLEGSTAAAAVTTYDSKLWRADYKDPQIAWYDIESVNASITPAWGDFIPVGVTGDILKMTSFIGRLFIATTDSIWAYEAGRAYEVIDLRHLSTGNPWRARGFDFFLVAHGSLYWNLGEKIYRYTSGGMLEELIGTLNSQPLAATAVRRGLVVSTLDGWVWVIDTNTGGFYRLYHNEDRPIYALGSSGHRLKIIPGSFSWLGQPEQFDFKTPLPAAFGLFDFASTEAAGEPQWNPIAGSYAQTESHVYTRTSWIDLERPSLLKVWRRVRVAFENIPTTSWPSLTVRYRTDGNHVWEIAGRVDVSNPPQNYNMATFELPLNVIAREFQVQVELGTALVTGLEARPRIYFLEIEGEPVRSCGRDTRRKRISFNVVDTDNMELLTGQIENSCGWIASSIYSLTGSGVTHIVALPFPPPVGHTIKAKVELGPSGGAVPILPQCYTCLPSSCPGADFTLVVTEI